MTPKPKAEELKACPVYKIADLELSIVRRIDSCPHRRTPTKDEGEASFQSAVSGLWYSNLKSAGDLATVKINGKRYRIGDCELIELPESKPTAPADEGGKEIWWHRCSGKIRTYPHVFCSMCPPGIKGEDVDFKPEQEINTLQAKLKSAEAVVEAGRELNMRMDVVHADEEYKSVWLLAHTHGGYQGPNYKDEKERFEAALSAHDNQQKQEPEEQHFIEEGLAERCKKV